MLQSERPELVVIASPTVFHKEQCIKAFEYGADVFCDKPLAMSLAETDEIIAVMKRSGGKLMVFQPHRISPESETLKKILSENILGDIYLMKRCHTGYSARDDWQAFKKNGGGMIYNYGAHFIDQLLHFFTYRGETISSHSRKIITRGDAEDVFKAVIETPEKVILDIDINQAAAINYDTWDVFGSLGGASFDFSSGTWKVRYRLPETEKLKADASLAAKGRNYPETKTHWVEKEFKASPESSLCFYSELYKYLALNSPPLVPVRETRELTRILEKCREQS
jgi:predicted dehydrogenase